MVNNFENEDDGTKTKSEVEDIIVSKAQDKVGRNIQLLLPLKIGDRVLEYIFVFKIDDFNLIKS